MRHVTITLLFLFFTACAAREHTSTLPAPPTPRSSVPDEAHSPVREAPHVERFHFMGGTYDHVANGCASSRSTDMVDQLVKHGFTVEFMNDTSFATIRPIVELIDPALPDTDDNIRFAGEKRSEAKEVYGTMGKWFTVARGISITFIVNVWPGFAHNSAGTEFDTNVRVSLIQRYHGEECAVVWNSKPGTKL